MKARRRVALGLALALAACGDAGPQGPGSFVGTLEVTGPPVGAAILDVTGDGIRGFEGTGDTRIFHDVTDPATGSHRVIAISATGTVSFRVLVNRVEVGFPATTVVDAAGTDNLPRGAAGVAVRFTGP